MSETTKTTLAEAEEQAEHAYDHEAHTEGAEMVEQVHNAAAAPVAAKPQVAASSAAEATKTAGALLDEWFASAIHNSEYSRDAARYNSIQKQYRSLRALIT